MHRLAWELIEGVRILGGAVWGVDCILRTSKILSENKTAFFLKLVAMHIHNPSGALRHNFALPLTWY